MRRLDPHPPETLDPLAREILDRLAGHAEAASLVLGGGVALKHYADFRATHDVDAWWASAPDSSARALVSAAVRAVADAHGFTFSERTWGDTSSYEIRDGDRRVFSFQVAVRDVELEKPVASAWAPIRLETLADNVGAKMNALVRRGAPRDFVDIYELVKRGAVTRDECWQLWQRKNPGVSLLSAKEAVVRNMAEIELRTPLESVPEAARAAARERRAYFLSTFSRDDA